MQYANYRIHLDVQSGGSGVVLSAKRGDTGRRIFVTLTDGGRPYVLEEDCYTVLTARKPDGSKVFHQCPREGGQICCTLTEQLLAVPGSVRCEVRVYGRDAMLLTSAAFELLVESTVWADGDVAESFHDFSALTDLIGRNQALLEELRELKESEKPKNGATFLPAVDPAGTLSWTNDGSLPNPEPVNLRGPKGEDGRNGEDGKDGEDGYTPVKGVDYCTEAEKEALVQTVLDRVPSGGGTAAQPAVSGIDFSNFDSGSFTETVDGNTVTHAVTFDSEGRPVTIDGISITWGAAE